MSLSLSAKKKRQIEALFVLSLSLSLSAKKKAADRSFVRILSLSLSPPHEDPSDCARVFSDHVISLSPLQRSLLLRQESYKSGVSIYLAHFSTFRWSILLCFSTQETEDSNYQSF
ncbi:hypothetical protein NE237_002659 [Protea cynaroides]|uniref:Uncharacterized protein n=1 Tax=Protea cynaroides TaxID=273540 RepID=A0A9Q0GMF9_9MAGN|nr:hypothetical protein NE237_002659 [Protea cynaroides]